MEALNASCYAQFRIRLPKGADAMRDKRARQIQKEIAKVLLNDWDPIDVSDVPRAQDEYDGYVGGVYLLLASRATPMAIAEHLAKIEREWMGLPGKAEINLEVAAKLCALDVQLHDES